MCALVAVICFVLALFGVHPAGLDLVVLGLVFVALHLLVGLWPLHGAIVTRRSPQE